jgi:hypothetical protein
MSCVRNRAIQLGDRAGRDGERLAERQALAARPNLKLGHLSGRAPVCPAPTQFGHFHRADELRNPGLPHDAHLADLEVLVEVLTSPLLISEVSALRGEARYAANASSRCGPSLGNPRVGSWLTTTRSGEWPLETAAIGLLVWRVERILVRAKLFDDFAYGGYAITSHRATRWRRRQWATSAELVYEIDSA